MSVNLLLLSHLAHVSLAKAEFDATDSSAVFAPLRLLFGATVGHNPFPRAAKVRSGSGARIEHHIPLSQQSIVADGFQQLSSEVQELNHELMEDVDGEHVKLSMVNEVEGDVASLMIATARKEDLRFGCSIFAGFAAIAGLIASWRRVVLMFFRLFRRPVAEEHSQVDLVWSRQKSVEAFVIFTAPDVSSRHVEVRMQAAASDSSATPQLASLLPIWLAVLVHMLGVGVTLATLPFFFVKLGASSSQLAIAISCFSACQMIGSPLLIQLSTRVGRLPVLRLCLGGNALAALLTATAGGWKSIALARGLAGFTAACVPVAQASVADVCPPGVVTSKALTRVSAASSMGIILGPMFAGLVSEIANAGLGVTSPALQSRLVFVASGFFAFVVLLLTSRIRLPTIQASSGTTTHDSGSKNDKPKQSLVVSNVPWFAQWISRLTALICTSSSVTGITTYALFALNHLGYGQRQLSLTQSCAASVALCTNLLFLPKLIDRLGEAVVCSIGLALLGLSIGSSSLLTVQPWHVMILMVSRAGLVMAETQAAALTARNSTDPESRARNLAFLQSSQSGSRIFAPLLASWLYRISVSGGFTLGPAGSLPFLFAGSFALICAPLPLLLHDRSGKSERSPA